MSALPFAFSPSLARSSATSRPVVGSFALADFSGAHEKVRDQKQVVASRRGVWLAPPTRGQANVAPALFGVLHQFADDQRCQDGAVFIQRIAPIAAFERAKPGPDAREAAGADIHGPVASRKGS